jgi:predicted SAM-dependent methyltransferase
MEMDYTKMPVVDANCTKLNVGSGDMLMKGYINLDMNRTTRNGMTTDCIWDVEKLTVAFSKGRFTQIVCFHVIEHFPLKQAKKIIKDMYDLLAPMGELIMEGPDILGIIQLYHEGHHIMNTPLKVIQQIYGSPTHIDTGLEWLHKWGWTRETMRKEMEQIGFKVTHNGVGQSHGMGRRDYRVAGRKI